MLCETLGWGKGPPRQAISTVGGVTGREPITLFGQQFLISPYSAQLHFYTTDAFAQKQANAYFRVGDIIFAEQQLTGATSFNVTVERAWLALARDATNVSSVQWNLTELLATRPAPAGRARRWSQ